MTQLGELVIESDVRAGTEFADLPVLSLTKNRGLIAQADRFHHRVATEDVSRYKVVRHGQIVVNPYVLWEGAVHALRNMPEGLVSPVYSVWSVRRDKVDWQFIDFLLRTPSLLQQYEQLGSGVVKRRRSVSKAAFLSIDVDVPRFDEQSRIASILATLRFAESKAEMALILKRQAYAAARDQFFNVELPVVPLSQVADDIRYGTSERCEPAGSGPSVLGIRNITDVGLDPHGANRLSHTPKEDHRGWLEPGDLLFVRTNADQTRIGRCAVFEGTSHSTLFASYLLRARIHDPTVDPRYVAHYAASGRGRAALRAGASGAADGKFNMNAPTLGSWLIPKVNISVQAAVCDQLDAWLASIAADEGVIRETRVCFASVSGALLEKPA